MTTCMRIALSPTRTSLHLRPSPLASAQRWIHSGHVRALSPKSAHYGSSGRSWGARLPLHSILRVHAPKAFYSAHVSGQGGDGRLQSITVEPDPRLIESGAISERPNAIVFVHSVWHGPWAFAEMQSHFARSGYTSHAVALPFDRSDATIESFITELCRLPTVTPPVLVGHGFGAYVCLKYLESFAARGLAMLSPFPAAAEATYIDKIRNFDKAVAASVRGDSSHIAALFNVPCSPHPPRWFSEYVGKLTPGIPRAAVEQFASEPALFEAHTGLPMLTIGAVGDALCDRDTGPGEYPADTPRPSSRATRGNCVSEVSDRFGIADEWRVLLGSGKYGGADSGHDGVDDGYGVLVAGPNAPRATRRIEAWLDGCGL